MAGALGVWIGLAAARFQLINVAEWSSVDAFQAATERMRREVRPAAARRLEVHTGALPGHPQLSGLRDRGALCQGGGAVAGGFDRPPTVTLFRGLERPRFSRHETRE